VHQTRDGSVRICQKRCQSGLTPSGKDLFDESCELLACSRRSSATHLSTCWTLSRYLPFVSSPLHHERSAGVLAAIRWTWCGRCRARRSVRLAAGSSCWCREPPSRRRVRWAARGSDRRARKRQRQRLTESHRVRAGHRLHSAAEFLDQAASVSGLRELLIATWWSARTLHVSRSARTASIGAGCQPSNLSHQDQEPSGVLRENESVEVGERSEQTPGRS
jgi:hypothetical protein